jgi:hypothetical protein
VRVTKDGAAELYGRAARIAAEKARIEAEKKAEAERKRIEKERKEAEEKKKADAANQLAMVYMMRAVPSRDWCPIGEYAWVDSPVLMDQTKDLYRIVRYEINRDVEYTIDKTGAHITELDIRKRWKAENPEENTDVVWDGIEEEPKKGIAAVPPKFTKEEIASMLKAAQEDEARKTLPMKHRPDADLFGIEPWHGNRVFYTDASVHNVDLDELAELIENLGFYTKTLEFKDAYDGGLTLKKHDSYPKEDPAEWEHVDTDKYVGWLRVGRPDDTEDW